MEFGSVMVFVKFGCCKGFPSPLAEVITDQSASARLTEAMQPIVHRQVLGPLHAASTDKHWQQNGSYSFSAFKRGSVTGCHLCYKLVHEMYGMLNLLQPTLRAIIGKVKHLEATRARQVCAVDHAGPIRHVV